MRGGFSMSNELYDVLVRIVKYVLPALGTLYFGLSQLWGFPYGEQVVGTISLVATFLSVCLGISSYNYKKGLTDDKGTD